MIKKAILIDIIPVWTSEEEYSDRMLELENLVSTYWSLVVLHKVQKRFTPDYRTYVGTGKLDEIRVLAEELGADLVIVGNILKPSQIYNINEFFRTQKSELMAWDRVDLILKIFERHANSPEARLQIELAAIKHMWPRIFGMWMELSRQWWWSSGWWSWMRWIWETNTEIMKRHLREKELKIIEKLKIYEKTRAVHRKSRERKNLQTIWIVGYTNAGKSSLMNSLTHKWVLSEDKLFATLGTNVGKFFIWSEDFDEKLRAKFGLKEFKWKEFLLNDTIWFIRDLPPDLIKAFSSTLEDSIESAILLHVIDSSDEKVEEKIEVVEDTLAKIWAIQPRIYVFNKIDLISKVRLKFLKEKFIELNPIFVSANEKIGISSLKHRILETLPVN